MNKQQLIIPDWPIFDLSDKDRYEKMWRYVVEANKWFDFSPLNSFGPQVRISIAIEFARAMEDGDDWRKIPEHIIRRGRGIGKKACDMLDELGLIGERYPAPKKRVIMSKRERSQKLKEIRIIKLKQMIARTEATLAAWKNELKRLQ